MRGEDEFSRQRYLFLIQKVYQELARNSYLTADANAADLTGPDKPVRRVASDPENGHKIIHAKRQWQLLNI